MVVKQYFLFGLKILFLDLVSIEWEGAASRGGEGEEEILA